MTTPTYECHPTAGLFPWSTADQHVRTPDEQVGFEVRRLQNLVGLYDASRDDRERLANADALARATRRFVTEFCGLEAKL